MYDFKNQSLNKLLKIAGYSLGFIILTLILPSVVNFVLTVAIIWAILGLVGWSIGKTLGKIKSRPGIPFYRDTEFYEHIACGLITLLKYAG